MLSYRLIPTADLIPYARNARTHSEAQVAKIASSIREFGFLNPVITDGKNGLVAGHGRVLAAKKLGLKEIPCLEASHLTEAQRRAYILADNRMALDAGWDNDLLKIELGDLQGLDFDLALTGFDLDEIGTFLADKTEGLTDPDEAPAVPDVPVSKPGDLWILGDHRVLCGDSTVMTDVEKLMGGQLADMSFCDSPYNVDYANAARRGGKDRRILNDALGDAFYQFLYDTCLNLLMFTKGACYMSMSSSELDTLQRAFKAAGGKWSTFIIWAKNTFTLGRADYQRQYEPILYGWKEGSQHYWCGARDQGDVWFIDKPRVNDLHPTMKPVELVERAITNSSKSRDIVLDLFGGSGSTLIACEKTGRHARLMELDPKYVDVIIQRWQDFTGQKATLESSGQTFKDVASDRHAPILEAAE